MKSCKECQEEQLRRNGNIDYWYCENRCLVGRKVHNEELGTNWDMLDKQSSYYKEANLNGD